MIEKKEKLPDVIDAEYDETTKYIDTITPRIEEKTTLVPDKKGNKLLWYAILAGIGSLIIFLLSIFLSF